MWTRRLAYAVLSTTLAVERTVGGHRREATMQLRLLTASIIYMASYLPLSVILLCQDLRLDRLGGTICNPFAAQAAPACTLPLEHPWPAIGAVVACAVAFALAVLALGLADPKRKIIIKESKHVPADLMNYVLPYVVAFMGLDYKDAGKMLGFGIFFLWIFIITYRSGQVILNPVLTVLGWRLYDASYSYDGGTEIYTGTVLSRVMLHADATYRQAAIQDVLIVKGANNDP